MVKKGLCFFLCILLLGTLCGCQGSISVDSQAYAMSVGVEKGKEKKYRVYFQIPALDESNSFEIVSSEGDSFMDCVHNVNTAMSFFVNTIQSNFIVFSEEIAMSNELKDIIRVMLNTMRLKRTAYVIMCEGSVEDFLKGFDGEETLLNRTQLYVMNESDNSAMYPKTRMIEFYEQMMNEFCEPICAIGFTLEETGEEEGEKQEPADGESQAAINAALEQDSIRVYHDGEKTKNEKPSTDGLLNAALAGTGIFKNQVLIAKLDEELTKYLLMARGEVKAMTVEVSGVYEDTVPTLLAIQQEKNPTTTMTLIDGVPYFERTVYLRGEIHNISQQADLSNLEEFENIEKVVEDYILNKLNAVGDICYELEADAIGLGEAAVQAFTTDGEWEAFDWENRFPQSKLKFNIELTLTKVNLIRS